MSLLSLIKPIVGKPSATEDPKVGNALTAIENWANGQIDSSNLKGEGVETGAIKNLAVTEGKLSAALQALINQKVSGLNVVSHPAGGEVKAGELYCTPEGPVTLPKAAAGVSLGVAASGTVKVKVTAGDLVFGDFLNGVAEFTLLQNQHIGLLGFIPKVWLIISGEPKREAGLVAGRKTYKANEEHLANALRPTFIVVSAEGETGKACSLEAFVGTESMGYTAAPAVAAEISWLSLSFKCPAGSNWQAKTSHCEPEVFASYTTE